jgi:WD40 repeat protein
MQRASEFIYKRRLKSLKSHRRGWTEPLVGTMTQLLASASDDQTIRPWDPITGGYLQELKHSHPVYAVAFSPDGAFLTSALGDFAIILWTEEAEEALRMSNSYLTYYHVISSLFKLHSLGLSCFC